MELTRDEETLLDAGKRDLPFPTLGGWFTDEEVGALTDALRDSLDWRVGFHGPQVDQFERESTALYGTAHLWDDGIIDPRDTRRVLAFTLSIARESIVRPLNPITFGVARM